MATPEQQLLSSLNPQMARLLDEQLAGQQAAQGVDRGYQGIVSSAVQGATMLGNIGSDAFGFQRQMGPNEMQMVQQQNLMAQEKQKSLELIKANKENAKEILYNKPELGAQQVGTLLKAIDRDPSGKLANQIIEKYGLPDAADPSERYKVAGNNVFDTKTRQFIKEPVKPNDPNKSAKNAKTNLSTVTGLDENNFTKESWKEATDIMVDIERPLAERLKEAQQVLEFREQEMSEELQDYLVGQLEVYDVKGLKNRFDVISTQANLLDQGIVTGFGANALTTIASIGQRFGILSSEQADTLARTQTFDSNAGNLVAEVIKAFGAGTGLSDADREYATKIAGGLITLEEMSLKRILEITQRRAIAEAEAYNKQLAKLGEDWASQAIEVPRFRLLRLEGNPDLEVREYNGRRFYVDVNPKGHLNEVYDEQGYRIQ
jgi:hypothetical protein